MIGIIAAMEVEARELISHIDNKQVKIIGAVEYTFGTLYGKDVVIAISGEGKVNAAMCTQAMIMAFNPDIIINTGVAGGLADDLKTGDTVVATSVCQHDSNYTARGYEIGYLFGIDRVYIDCDKKISALLSESVKQVTDNCKNGVIASGDLFISSDKTKKHLKSAFNAVACDMESGAIGHVCCKNDVPFAILRAISDGGGDGAAMTFGEFCDMAVNVSSAVIKNLLEKIR